ncbi:hypothetical protein BURKHO8Y_200081 [Burkholderia sp. 8Y]|nr:hypothetical protein BURKHO8Y_200081 [Burkholderia sp. 8Y]
MRRLRCQGCWAPRRAMSWLHRKRTASTGSRFKKRTCEHQQKNRRKPVFLYGPRQAALPDAMRWRKACWPYWLAPEAGAADEAAASEAAPAAEAASLAAADALDAAAFASEAAAAGAEAADESLAALGAAVSLDLLHAARATAANRDATRRDFFMITSFYG